MSIILPMTQFLEDASEVYGIVQERVNDEVVLQLGLKITGATIIASSIINLTPPEHIESFDDDSDYIYDQAQAAMIVAWTAMRESMAYAGSLGIPFPEGETRERLEEIQSRMGLIWTSVFG